MKTIVLKGMTWDHPRGVDPLLACARLWREQTGVEIHWDRQSLQGFESWPLEDLAARYDLIVIDHPHVGQAAAEGCLLPFDTDSVGGPIQALAAASVGPSFASYEWKGKQWALPIDAAAQVQAWRPGRLEAPATSWDDVAVLARDGRILLPLRSPHPLMCFFTLAAQAGHACNTDPDQGPLIEPDPGMMIYEQLRELALASDPQSFQLDPIAALEMLAQDEGQRDCIPLTYGYISYGIPGFRPHILRFADIPAGGPSGPAGSTLGGTGMAVSAHTVRATEAFEFACWVASRDVQRSAYAANGGQVGHLAAWDDPAVDAQAHGFYSATRATLQAAWLRPRFNGYMAFQADASELLSDAIRSRRPARQVICALNARYARAPVQTI